MEDQTLPTEEELSELLRERIRICREMLAKIKHARKSGEMGIEEAMYWLEYLGKEIEDLKEADERQSKRLNEARKLKEDRK